MAEKSYKLLIPTGPGDNFATRWHTPGLTPQEWAQEEWTTSDARQDLYVLDPDKWYQERTLVFDKGVVITHLFPSRTGRTEGASPTLLKRSGVWDGYQIWETEPRPPVVSPVP